MPAETLIYRFFAKTYHYSEQMTDEASVDAVTWWPVIEQAESEAEARKIRDEQRRAQRLWQL